MLNNTLYRLTREKKLTVGYFGGSITDGTGASDMDTTSYRGLVTAWLAKKYPDADVRGVNAAIGGTGTGYGMFRMEHDLFECDPGLVFVEFSINDFEDPYDNVLPRIEAIFRKIRKERPTTDVVAVISTSWEVADLCARGCQIDSAEATVTAAHRYGVPVVNAGLALAFRIYEDGKNYVKYIPDDSHPSDIGYTVMAGAIEDLLSSEFEGKEPDALVPATVPEPICKDILEGARMNYISEIDCLSLNGFTTAHADNRLFDERLESSRIGDSFSFSFTGPVLGFIWDDGCPNGDVAVSVDGGEPMTVKSWDRFVRSFHRMEAALFLKGLDPTVPHRATVTTSNLYPDPENGHPDGAVRIVAVLTA